MKITQTNLKIGVSDYDPLIIAEDLCSAEDAEQIEQISKEMKEQNIVPSNFSERIWKPRTRPDSFRKVLVRRSKMAWKSSDINLDIPIPLK